jgi:HYR domain
MTRGTRSRRLELRAALVLGLTLVVAATAAAPAASEPQAAAGTLDVQARFDLISYGAACPGGVPPEATECRARTGDGFVRGLGNVSVSYTWPLEVGPPTCPAAADEYNLARFAKPLATTGRLSVAGKGEITFTLAEGAQCVPLFEPPPYEPQEFTITGGTESFAAASGTGMVERSVGGGDGTETWTGTLEVPGLEFDVTAPKLNGAGSKTVRARKGAKTARVTFKVMATDDVDGPVPVLCQPKSGSRFKLGRTTVGCEATDSTGNTATAGFTVTVRPRR